MIEISYIQTIQTQNMLQCDLMITVHHCMNKCFDKKTCPVREPSRSRFRKVFSGNCGHLRISCAEWLPDFKTPKAHLIEKRTSQSLHPAMPPICKRNAETHAWHPNVLKDLGESAQSPLRSVVSHLVVDVCLQPYPWYHCHSCCSQEFGTDRWKNAVAWQEGR